MKKIIKLLTTVLAAASCSTIANAASFTFSDQLIPADSSENGLVTGSFDGTLTGQIITNISNISVSLGGYAFPQVSANSFNNGSLVMGGAVASLDGSVDNFDFSNFIFSPHGGGASAEFDVSNQSLVPPEAFLAPFFIAAGQAPGTSLSIKLVPPATAMPEASEWAMMIIGFAAIGFKTRRRGTAARYVMPAV